MLPSPTTMPSYSSPRPFISRLRSARQPGRLYASLWHGVMTDCRGTEHIPHPKGNRLKAGRTTTIP